MVILGLVSAFVLHWRTVWTVAIFAGAAFALLGVPLRLWLARAIERARKQAPVNEITRVMNLHSREPFECRRGDVVIVTDPDDGWVRIKSAQDWVAN